MKYDEENVIFCTLCPFVTCMCKVVRNSVIVAKPYILYIHRNTCCNLYLTVFDSSDARGTHCNLTCSDTMGSTAWGESH